ncbi:MAG: Rieske (2Fe-2S) protein [Alphaproteobacteria bacterium]|nr:Rieske (2Fe-2S) protein [Alphaproteobacteria bacterium]
MAQWIDAGPVEALKDRGRRVFKAGRNQILLIASGERIFACNNRCPHEGYPLSEGTLGAPCTLTCNWHNWKFDLSSGETVVGGDQLRLYPVEVRDRNVWVDVADVPAEQRQRRALENLEQACADNDYERMAREVARHERAGGEPLEPLRHMVRTRAAHFEYGMTHAYAAAPDWVALGAIAHAEDERLTARVEPIAHIAWDTLRQPEFPFTQATKSWDATAFAAAIESEDEPGAIALLNGALTDGVSLRELKPAFAKAALAHYQDFGHSAIYARKAFELIDALGQTVAGPVLRSLARSIIYATREDRIPEFRAYPQVLAKKPQGSGATCAAEQFIGLSVNSTLDRVSTMAGSDEAKYRTLLEASAIAMLRFDLAVDLHTDRAVSHNVRWLDFTHMLTFGNAVRQHCTETPELWQAALLQMACFLGRNAPYLLPAADENWFVADVAQFFAHQQRALFDHGIREPIFSCHRVKMLTAVKEEVAWAGEGSLSRHLVAATNRYLNTPIKLHHALRMAHQALSFVEAEG